MKRFLLALLIVLTVLRGLVGDVMAMQMSSNAVKSAAAMRMNHHHSTEQVVKPDMPCHSDNDEAVSSEQANGCNTCQVCHLSVFIPAISLQVHHLSARSAQAQRSESFLSAEMMRSIKPPIL